MNKVIKYRAGEEHSIDGVDKQTNLENQNKETLLS